MRRASDVRLIGICGQARMGKDTVADALISCIGKSWRKHPFARGVKDIVCKHFDVGRDEIERWKTSDDPPPGFNKNMRSVLQMIGDGFREVDPNVWIRMADLDHVEHVVIPDVRYVNEAREIQRRGGLVLLVGRKVRLSDDENPSERTVLSTIEWCYKHAQGKPVLDVVDTISRLGNEVECPPEFVQHIDMFLTNDGSREDLNKCVFDIVSQYGLANESESSC